jgi:hypothetical protein
MIVQNEYSGTFNAVKACPGGGFDLCCKIDCIFPGLSDLPDRDDASISRLNRRIGSTTAALIHTILSKRYVSNLNKLI